MANRSTARHRAACRPSTPFSIAAKAMTSPEARRKALAVAGSGLAIGVVAAQSVGQVAAADTAAPKAAPSPAVVNKAVTAPQGAFAVPQAAVQVIEQPKAERREVRTVRAAAAHKRAAQEAPVASAHEVAALPAANNSIVGIAMRYLGTPYRWGGSSPAGFDCSGFVSYVYAQAGHRLPHQSGAIASTGRRIPVSAAQPGDVLWHRGHVGIYLGNGRVAHANHRGGSVVIDSIKHLRFTSAVRF